MMQDQFRAQKDRKELMGFAAPQMGIPSDAIYLEYSGLPNNSELFLVNPQIKPIPGGTQSFMLKLVKCPNSPLAYNIGIFNREFKISSTNSPDIKMFPLSNVSKFDPDFDFSANIQRIIWASKGIIPGNPDTIPMNYINISNVVEANTKLSKHFKCYVQPKEIEKIVSTFDRVGDLSLQRGGAKYLMLNLLELLGRSLNRDWIEIPSVNLFSEQFKKVLAS